jgi:hypothetical protein
VPQGVDPDRLLPQAGVVQGPLHEAPKRVVGVGPDPMGPHGWEVRLQGVEGLSGEGNGAGLARLCFLSIYGKILN